MSLRIAGLLLALAVLGASSTASAGTPEQLSSVMWNPADPTQLVVGYDLGGGGMFVSQDGGKKFGWLCATGIAPELAFRDMDVQLNAAGAMFIGIFNGVWRGQSNGCGFSKVPELDGQNISGTASDPLDPKRIYLSTTTGRMENGIFADDGLGGPFVQVGTKFQGFLSTLHVVALGAGRRLYTTGSVHDVQTNTVSYSVRYSEDEGATWVDYPYDIAQFGPKDDTAVFRLLAVDPTNPEHLLARVQRDKDKDSLIHSLAAGKPGTWQLMAEPTEVTPSSVTFTPEGTLYFGDSDQMTKGLFVVDKGSEAPKLLNDTWRVFCLNYDASQKRLLGCSNYFLFGSVDTTTGELTPLLDLRCAEHFAECPGQEPMMTTCEQLAIAEFCHVSHWPLAPVCAGYNRGEILKTYEEALGYTCKDGFPMSRNAAAAAAGSGTVDAAGATALGSAGTGTTGAAASSAGSAAAPSSTPSNVGCGCAAMSDGAASDLQGLWAVLSGAWLLVRSRRAKRRA